jgi:hypothetical protein
MGLCQRAAGLHQQVSHTRGRLRPEGQHQPLQIDAVDVLHGVIEIATKRAAVVEHHDRVRVAEPAGRRGLQLEAAQLLFAGTFVVDHFDGGASS